MNPRSLLAVLILGLCSLCPPAVAEEDTNMTFAERSVQEVHDLHEFFEQWSVAELPDTDEAYARLRDALAPDFTMVTPEGRRVHGQPILDEFRGANGRWPGGGSIEITEAEILHVAGDLAVATYVEHQEYDVGEGRQMSKRRSTVVFREEPDAPNGVRWLHVHETWIAPPHAAGPGHAGHAGHEGHAAHGDDQEWQHSGEHGTGHGGEHGEHAEHGEHGSGHAGHGQGFQHDFSDVERWAKIFDDPERVDWQKPEHVVELMELRPGMRVADLGAGTGFFLGYLSLPVGAEGEVQALDVADTLVEHMQQRANEAGWHNVKARLVATDDPGFEPGTMDRILIVDVWHHISDRGAYAAKLREALKDDGRVVLLDFDMDSPEGPPKQHRLPPEHVVAELEAGGLKAWIVEDEQLPRQYVVMASSP